MEKMQKLTLTDRKHLLAAGIQKISGFRETEVRLLTQDGTLIVRGRGLFVEKLDPDAGEAVITGRIDSLMFSGSGPETGFLKKLMG